MAIAPSLARKFYEDLSPEEIVEKYNDFVEKIKTPNTKEEIIKKYIDNILKPSETTNIKSSIKALKELYFEKTGKNLPEPDVNNSPKITLDDVISYVSKPDPFWTTVITDYFKKVNKTDDEKITFLTRLYVDKESFNEFTKEILKTDDALATYNKYEEKSNHYIGMNSIIG